MARRALLIVNENSSRGRGDLQPLLDILRDSGDIDTAVHTSRSRDHVAEIVAEYGHDVDMVIMGGGDGTMNAAVDCLHARGLPLGVLPLGTANDLARTLGIPADPEAACRTIAQGRLHRIDLGRVNGKLFFNAASVGVAARLSHRLDRDLKARWGVLSYPLRVRELIGDSEAFDAEIRGDDGAITRVRSIQIAVGNGRCYGGGMRVAEDSAIDDGRLDLYSLEPQSLWRLVLALPSLRAGRHEQLEGSLSLQGRRFTVTTAEPMDVATDGEVTTCTPAVFEVLPAALPVLVPAEGEGEGVTRMMLRDDRAVLLDDVIVAVKRSVQDMRDAAATPDPPDRLSAALEAIADRRGRLVERLEDALRGLGDLPSAPDPDRQTFSHLTLRLKALLSGDQAGTLAEAALTDEDDLTAALSVALQADLPAEATAALRDLQADVAAARQEITAAAR
ncbi:lipid kinase [Caenispirillum bisanense]|uniref:lipid kinase n=1 Tax=Caenispirillum bisanense TaxID=414052 RepID=UPI0031E3BB12